MTERAIIGVDLGTQGAKAALYSESGRFLVAAFVKSRLLRPAEGTVEEDPEYQLSTVYQAVKEAVRNSGIERSRVVAMGIAGQMAGVIGIGEGGLAVTPYDSWLDTRCAPQIRQMAEQAGDEVLAKTGSAPSYNHGPKILWWIEERRETFERIAAFVQPGGYAAMRLCGLDETAAFIDHTYLHFSGFAANDAARWDPELCARFGLGMEKLPRIVAPHEVVGRLTPEMASRCGLSPDVAVVAGCGDTAASFLACGAAEEGICVDVAGTASVFAATTTRFVPDCRHRTLSCGRSAIPGLWHPYAYVNGGGLNLEWFVDLHGKDLDRLNHAAAEIPPDPGDPFFVPHFGGRVAPSQPRLRGAWAGLTWGQTEAHLYRAMLEGIALEYGIYRNILAELLPDLKLREVRVTGGGERSAPWNQMKADVLQMNVTQIHRNEGAPLGSALLAAKGAGLVSDLGEAAARWIELGLCCEPRAGWGAHYSRRLRRYECLLALLNDWSEDE